jgi:hypothetical protein
MGEDEVLVEYLLKASFKFQTDLDSIHRQPKP